MDPPVSARQRLDLVRHASLSPSACANFFLDSPSAMKNASSAYRGAPMPGGRSFTQFRAARIRRVSFQWQQAAGPGTPDKGSPQVGSQGR